MITVDTLRADRLGGYGYGLPTDGDPATPYSLRALLDRSVRYEQAYAPQGQTLPSFGTIWTGRSPLEHGARDNISTLQGTTVAEKLASRGWATAAFVANRVLSPDRGIANGFETYRVELDEDLMTEYALAHARELFRSERPSLLWVHYMSPHAPYEPPASLEKAYTAGIASQVAGDRETLNAIHDGTLEPTAADRARLQALYDAEIQAAGDRIERLLRGLDRILRANGREDGVLGLRILFASDHGEELGEHHDYFMHVKSLHQGVIRVPLAIAEPGAEPRSVEGPVGLNQLASWMLDERMPEVGAPCASAWRGRIYAVRDARWTLLHNPDRLEPSDPPPGHYPYREVELYDRLADPQELLDRAVDHPDEVRRLLGELSRWWDRADHRPADRIALTPAQAHALEELGYVAVIEEETPFEGPTPPSKWQPR